LAQTAAIYIHVPFCRQRCAYCHFDIKVFHPRTDPGPFIDGYLDAVCRELEHRGRMLDGRKVTSVFLGGGTPSRLPTGHLERLMSKMRRCFDLAEDAEISIEVNPEDVTPEYPASLLAMGFTRLSLGVQTFDDAGLTAVGRAHDHDRARAVLEQLPVFPHGRSIDLILGLPHQTRASLERDLETLLGYDLEHVSLYLLERDLPTPLDKRASMLPDDDAQADAYERVDAVLTGAGYEHYEISNFAKPGFSCRHNLVYWRSGDYLGIGPSACGRVGLRFQRNEAMLGDYRAAVAATGSGVAEEEVWSEERLRQERLVMGLRLSEGVPIELVSEDELDALARIDQLWCRHGDRLRLTPAGRLLANEVFAVFISEPPA